MTGSASAQEQKAESSGAAADAEAAGPSPSSSGAPASFIITHSVSKRHNIGTIVRSATAFGVKEVRGPRGMDEGWGPLAVLGWRQATLVGLTSMVPRTRPSSTTKEAGG